MTEALKLTSPSAEPWDLLRFLWRLRDARLLAQLKPVETSVLLLALSRTDARGECDLPMAATAKHLDRTRRAVMDAIRGLERRSLLTCIGRSHGAPVLRYRLLVPSQHEPQQPSDIESNGSRSVHSADSLPLGVFDDDGAVRIPLGETVFRGGNCAHAGEKARSTGGERAFPLVKSLSEIQSEISISRGDAREDGDLFAGDPPYDRAAAAALCAGGFSKRQAHGLVNQYRPTVAQVRAVIANAAAWRWAHRRGQAPRLNNAQGFIRSSLRSGSWALDDRVHQVRRSAKRRAELAAKRRAIRAQARPVVDASGPDVFEQIPIEQLPALKAAALERMTPAIRRLHADRPASDHGLRAAIIELARAGGLIE